MSVPTLDCDRHVVYWLIVVSQLMLLITVNQHFLLNSSGFSPFYCDLEVYVRVCQRIMVSLLYFNRVYHFFSLVLSCSLNVLCFYNLPRLTYLCYPGHRLGQCVKLSCIHTVLIQYKYQNVIVLFWNWQLFLPHFTGEGLQVTLDVTNHSSRAVKPKFILYEKKSFFAQGRRKVCTNEILKEKAEAVASSSKETVTKVISIPRELPPSILNCSIIKLEYRLKVNWTILWSLDCGK